jgi:hypothetical protein
LISLNAIGRSLPRLKGMDWIGIAKWFSIGVGALVAVGGLVVGVLVWFLNHPRLD